MPTIEYEIKRYKRAKYIRIAVKPGGKVVVSMPWRAPKYLAKQFVERKIDWVLQAQEKMSRVQTPLKVSTAQMAKHKRELKKIIIPRLAELNKAYGFSYKLVSVRNQKTRWGSCSKSGTLSFNYKLLFVPEAVRDYVLVHELCHIQEMNHSKKFWSLVAQVLPNYRALRTELKRISM